MLRISSTAPITPIYTRLGWPLFSTTATRQIEHAHANCLPPHTLMERAGKAVARLAMAIAPHAQRIWIACGPGNNGGDGFEAAAHLKAALPHTQILVSEVCQPDQLPPDARQSRENAQRAGVQWVSDRPSDLSSQDLCIDALLGIGLRQAPPGLATDQHLLRLLSQIQQCKNTLLCVDIASGLLADTGQYLSEFAPTAQNVQQLRYTLTLLTMKPGLFTGQGRDACGQVWWDDLNCDIPDPQGIDTSHSDSPTTPVTAQPSAHLSNNQLAPTHTRPHNSHKGSFGDVTVIGGQGIDRCGISMTGAAWLAALSALHAGAGRVMLALLDSVTPHSIAPWPEIMLRHPTTQDWSQSTVVCGCGGGQSVQEWLPRILDQASQLVLDADALNAIAAHPTLALQLRQRSQQQQKTILTPHPLEAARLLKTSAEKIQTNRLGTCLQLSEKFQCTAVLKGSGTVITNPQQQAWINTSGNARLATGGTGDVLAGLIGALWAQGLSCDSAAIQGAFRHGHIADSWPANIPFSSSALAQHLSVTQSQKA